MSTTSPSRRVVVAALCAVVGAGAAAASAAEHPTTLRLLDRAGDANGLNDQGEGLVGGVSTGRQVDQADLRAVDVRSPRAGSRSGLRVSFTTTARPAPLADGTALAYGVVLEPRRDCRLLVEHVSGSRAHGGAPTAPTGLLTHTCDGGHRTEVVLPTSVTGRTATVEVPYRLLPVDARTAAVGATAYVRTLPVRGSAARPVELDSAR